jgi:hypothetical protein
MSDMTISEFCERHNACQPGREWALANCVDMAEAWATAKPRWMLWIATRPGVLTNRELRLCFVQVARSVEHLMTDQRSRDVVAIAERHADGLTTDEELAAACDAAYVAYAAARAAAAYAPVTSAARAAAYVAYAVASAYAYATAATAATAAASWQATAAWLRKNTSPNFTKEDR